MQTVVAHRSEIWTFDVDPDQKLVFTGSSEGEMKAWKLDHDAMEGGVQEVESGEVRVDPHLWVPPLNVPNFWYASGP